MSLKQSYPCDLTAVLGCLRDIATLDGNQSLGCGEHSLWPQGPYSPPRPLLAGIMLRCTGKRTYLWCSPQCCQTSRLGQIFRQSCFLTKKDNPVIFPIFQLLSWNYSGRNLYKIRERSLHLKTKAGRWKKALSWSSSGSLFYEVRERNKLSKTKARRWRNALCISWNSSGGTLQEVR